jgi:1,4-dihydroxy-2-naphthoyl-CoA synthase
VRLFSSAAPFETILLSRVGRVGVITLNRPKALNALNSTLIGELNAAAAAFDADAGIGAIVLAGSERPQGCETCNMEVGPPAAEGPSAELIAIRPS